MDLVNLVLGVSEKINLKKPPIELRYFPRNDLGNGSIEVKRYYKRTGKEIYEPFLIKVAPLNAINNK